MASNTVAWLTAAKSRPFQVKSAPLWMPGENEPFDYPTILGQVIAGEIVAVGPNVTRFKQGNRVLAQAVGMTTKRNQDNGFQHYTIVQTNMACEIPERISFERAAVIPLGCTTAAAALFQQDFLNLSLPMEPPWAASGIAVLIGGRSSSVGSNAIQLAVAAGHTVITTASPKNSNYVISLGASEVFDYNDPRVHDDLVNAFKGKPIAGALDCIWGPGWGLCVDVVRRSAGTKMVATTKRGFPDPPEEDVTIMAVFATTIKDNAVGKAIYEDFLPKALKAGSFVPAPEPLVAGKGLESVQAAVDLLQKGVSAKKVVVLL